MKVGASLKGEAKLLTFRIALWASSYNIQSYRKEVLRPVFARVKVDGEGLEVLLHKFVWNKFEQLQLAQRVRAACPNISRIPYIPGHTLGVVLLHAEDTGHPWP